MSDWAPPGDGWVEGAVEGGAPAYQAQNYEVVTTWVVGRYGTHEQRVWHRPLVTPPPLPTRPGYYLASRPSYGDTVVVELLGSPEGQWVDAGDRNYLEPVVVQALGPLRRLVVLDDVIGYFRNEAGDASPRDDWRVRAADTIAAEWEVEA